MPFNDKGEFIRSAPARPSPSSTKTGAQPRAKQSNTIWWVIGTIAAIATLVGVVWVLWLIREWLMFGFGIWVAVQLRQMLR